MCWVFGATDADDAAFAAAGFDPTRELFEMRVAAAARRGTRSGRAGIDVRTFEPGRDEAAWLARQQPRVRRPPRQGGWTAATLARRMAEPWFDPVAFLLAFDADGLAGFNWMKVHDAARAAIPSSARST